MPSLFIIYIYCKISQNNKLVIWGLTIYLQTNVLKCIDKIEQLCYNMGTKSGKEFDTFESLC